jgi:hypothetical protein
MAADARLGRGSTARCLRFAPEQTFGRIYEYTPRKQRADQWAEHRASMPLKRSGNLV